MPKKQKAENEQVASTETTANPAPAKKRAATTAKSAAATHKSSAKRPAAKKPAVTEPAETAAQPGVEPDYIATVLEVVETTTIEEKQAVEPVAKSVITDPVAAREEIARIAYSYWEARNFAPGDPLLDWLRAEEEFRSRQYAIA